MISETSRYAANTLGSQTADNGQARVFIVPQEPSPIAFNYTLYTWREDDRVDLLGYDFLGLETLWWKIADANPEILDWSALPTGTVIRIPSA